MGTNSWSSSSGHGFSNFVGFVVHEERLAFIPKKRSMCVIRLDTKVNVGNKETLVWLNSGLLGDCGMRTVPPTRIAPRSGGKCKFTTRVETYESVVCV